jgi:hypothetical protein
MIKLLRVVEDTEEVKSLKRATARLLRDSAGTRRPALVYHYTSLETAVKILNSFEMWCTNVSFSKDTSEGVHGQGVIDTICTRDPDLLLEGARQLVADEIEGYATSFCAKPDELTQWREYGSNGRGVAIGVDAEVLSSRTNVAFSRIEYDPARQGKLVKNILNVFRARMVSAKSRPHRLRRLAAALTESLVVVRAMLKDPSYHTELEYRLLDALPKDPRRHDTALEYFQRGSRSVPFFRVDLRASTAAGATQPIREVWVGPCLEFASTEEQLRNTAAYVLQPFGIIRSLVPVRCD